MSNLYQPGRSWCPKRKRWIVQRSKLVNYTKFDTELIREIVRFVKPNGLGGFTLRIHNSWCWHGRAYCGQKLAKVYVPKETTERTRYKRPHMHDNTERKRGYIKSAQFTPTEDMVHLVAHELRHLWQPRNRNRRSVWGARKGRISERDADAYAIRMVRQWRRTYGFNLPNGAQPPEPKPKPMTLKEYRKTHEGKLGLLRAREKRWITRSKRAATALKKIQRAIKRLQKLQAGQAVQSAASLGDNISAQ